MAASDKATHFAIHDGARALITAEDINKVVSEAFVCSAATLGTPVTDTVKVVDKKRCDYFNSRQVNPYGGADSSGF